MSFIFNAPFLLILYFLDFLNSLLSLVHVICALKNISILFDVFLLNSYVKYGHALVKFPDGTTNLYRGCALKNLRNTADL